VRRSLLEGLPVVALESTVITHGLPAPENLKIAHDMKKAVREKGATPATIAILKGKIHVGLTETQLEELGTAKQVRKCSRRDISVVMARGGYGSTTVAATMLVAHRAGIKVFATGGIGGVSRQNPFDISYDLLELSRTPVTVVSAGTKAIMNMEATLEMLETMGVCVIGFGTDDFAAFYSRSVGLKVDLRCDTPHAVANIVRARNALELPEAVLVAAPVPPEYEWPYDEFLEIMQKAAAEMKEQSITGKDVTPYLLGRINELSEGKSKRANVGLLLNNARVAAEIAAALAK
jgi:pseudouridine-5'-phosphate glycosidase